MILLLFLDSTYTTSNNLGIFFNYTTLGIIVTVLIAIITLAVYFGKQHQKVKGIQTDVKDNIKPSILIINRKIDEINPILNSINSGVSYIHGILNIKKVTKSTSPLVLNDAGNKILRDSGIDKIIQQNYKDILNKVKERNPENAYKAQEDIIEIVKDLKNFPDLINVIELGAFSSGSDVETVLFVGAIDIRDKILEELKLYSQDIDEFDPNKKIDDK
jgi:hypothetical protein